MAGVSQGAGRQLFNLLQQLFRLHVSVMPSLVIHAAPQAQGRGAEIPLEAVWSGGAGPGHPAT